MCAARCGTSAPTGGCSAEQRSSSELEFDLPGSPANSAHHDLHVVTKFGHKLEHLGLANPAELSSSDP